MIRINVDPKAALGELSSIELKQLPYAVKTALNRVANQGQKAQQAHMRATLHLRREAWVVRAIKILKEDRATKSSWSVVIQVAPEFQEVASRLETGDDHVPKWGGRFCIPNAKVFGGKVITAKNQLHPMNLKFVRHGKQMQGNNRTFMVMGNGSQKVPLILQRTGAASTGYNHTSQLRGADGRFDGQLRTPGQRKAKQGVRLLYTLVKRSKVPAKLEFVQTISSSVNANWQAEMGKAMADAMRSR